MASIRDSGYFSSSSQSSLIGWWHKFNNFPKKGWGYFIMKRWWTRWKKDGNTNWKTWTNTIVSGSVVPECGCWRQILNKMCLSAKWLFLSKNMQRVGVSLVYEQKAEIKISIKMKRKLHNKCDLQTFINFSVRALNESYLHFSSPWKCTSSIYCIYCIFLYCIFLNILYI